MMKKVLLVVMMMVLMLSMMQGAYGETFSEAADEAAAICTDIGMILGAGDGVTPAYLATQPMRYQGAIMLLRLKGFYDTAVVYDYTANYNDVDELVWDGGKKVLGYLFSNQETIGFRGYPDGSFKPLVEMTAKQYYKLMLIALGYEENVDFAWNTTGSLLGTLEKAQEVGMTWLLLDDDFTVKDLTLATVEALRLPMKGTTETLAESLIDLGAIDSTVAITSGLILGEVPDPEPEATISIARNYEIALVLGRTVLTIGIENATYKDELGGNNSTTEALIDSFDGQFDTPVSWNSTVDITYSNITRLSDTSVMIEIPAIDDYRITGNEDVEVILSTLLFNEDIDSEVATTGFVIVDSGSGQIESPWMIIEANDLQFINEYPDHLYTVENNLEFSEVSYNPITIFNGELDGKNHTLSGLVLTATADTGTGLFKEIDGATISNLIIDNFTINGDAMSHLGLIAGLAKESTIMNTYVDNSLVTGKRVGLIVGRSDGDMTIENCHVDNSTASLNGLGSGSGGILGYSGDDVSGETIISECTVNNTEVSGFSSVGGIVGKALNRITVENSSYSGVIHGGFVLGGIIGNSSYECEIIDNSAFGTVTGSNEIGGIVGYVSGDYSITGNYAGQTSLKLTMEDISGYHAHRILSLYDTASTSMNNTAKSTMKLYNGLDVDHSSQFVSDASGLDGLDSGLLFIPVIPIIPDPGFFIPIPEIIIPGF